MDVPTIGSFIAALRKSRGLSQQAFAAAVRAALGPQRGCTTSYISKIETGDRQRPGPDMLSAMAAALELNSDERRHLLDLADAGGDRNLELPSTPAIISASMRRQLDQSSPGDHIACIDPRWILLDANEAYLTAFPGQHPGCNLLAWYFSHEAKHVLLDWRSEAGIQVAWWRGILARYHNAPWAARTHREMARYPDFRELWRAGRFLYRRPHPRMRLRGAEGQVVSLHVEHWVVPSTTPLVIFHGSREDSEDPAHGIAELQGVCL